MAEPAGRSRRVVLYGNPALRTRSRLVERITPELRQLFADLKASMHEAEGVGLAANQLGESVRCFAIDPRAADADAPAYCICNPELVGAEGRVEREEGCLSLPGLYDILTRPEFVRVRGLDEQGRVTTVEASGLLARALQHEIDHVNGILFVDHLGPARRQMVGTRLREFEERERSCA
jgi:peptide deformylase